MEAQKSTNMKLLYLGRTYLLGQFPVTFDDLRTRFINKVKPKQTDDIEFFFRDSESDKIVIADNEDLLKIKEIFTDKTGGFIKVEAQNAEQLSTTTLKEQKQQDKNACVSQEYTRSALAHSYHEFLSTKLPQVSYEF